MKTCSKCGGRFPKTKFRSNGSKWGKKYLRAQCKDCDQRGGPIKPQVLVTPNAPVDCVAIEQTSDFEATAASTGTRIQTIEQLLAATQVDLEFWSPHSGKVNTWETSVVLGPPDARRVEQVTNYQVTVSLERKVSTWLESIPAPKKAERPEPRVIRSALVLPDTQHGYRWARNYTALEPLHDPYAIDASIQLAAYLQPDVIVLLGDMLDAAAFGRFRVEPALKQTATPSLWALHWDLRRLRAACPRSRIVITPGNHDERINKSLIDHLPEAVALKGVGEAKTALDLRHLLHLDELEIEWIGSYGDSFWLWEEVEITHGTKHGRQVHDQVKGLSHTLIQGHAHLHAIASKRVTGPHVSKLVHAISPGCLCRVDGAVPAATSRVNWHQGVVYLQKIDKTTHATLHPIINGVIGLHDEVFTGQDTSNDLAHWMSATCVDGIGWPQIKGSEF